MSETTTVLVYRDASGNVSVEADTGCETRDDVRRCPAEIIARSRDYLIVQLADKSRHVVRSTNEQARSGEQKQYGQPLVYGEYRGDKQSKLSDFDSAPIFPKESTRTAMKKITVYPDARATAVLGTSAGALNQALECWANIIARASADNAKDFSAAEWCMIADVCKGLLWEPNIDNPAVLIAANIADGHQLDGTGYKWFCDEATELAGSLHRLGHGEQTKEMRQVDSKVKALVEKLAALDYAHAWAVITITQWFWDNNDLNFDPRRDPWWTLAYRKHAAEAKEREQ